MHRLGREQIELERFLVAVAEFREAFAVWLRAFLGSPDYAARILEQIAVERPRRPIARALPAAEGFEVIVDRRHFRGCFLRLLDTIVRSEAGLELRVCAHRVAQCFFPLLDRTPVGRIEKRRQISVVTLSIVFYSADVVLDPASVL